MSITSINNSEELKSYLEKNSFFNGLYIRELHNSLEGKKPKSSSLILYLIKSLGFLFFHFLLTLRPRTKFSKSKNIYLSPDFLFDIKSGFHKYWENIPNQIDLSEVEFAFFSNTDDRLFSRKKGISKQIDSFFTFRSFIKLLIVGFKFHLFFIKIFLDFFIKNLKSISYVKSILNLGSLNDYFLYYLLEDFSRNKRTNSTTVILSGEFQFWELGLFNYSSKKRFLYQHSGIRFNDPRISFFQRKNNQVNLLVTSSLQREYLKHLKFINIGISKNYRNNDLWIKVDHLKEKEVFFGSLDISLDMLILAKLGEKVYYKTHPSLTFKNHNNNWNDLEEKIYPIVYSQSAISKNLLESKVGFKVIFKKNYEMSILEVKSYLENTKASSSIILKDYYLSEITF